MAAWLHGVCVGACLFVCPLCGFSLSLFCNYQGRGGGMHTIVRMHTTVRMHTIVRMHTTVRRDYVGAAAGVHVNVNNFLAMSM